MKKNFLLFASAAWLALNGNVQAANDTCPIDGKPVKAEFVLSVNDKQISFCSSECLAEYKAKLNVIEAEPENCPISGKPATQENSLLRVSTKVYNFCCDDCIQKFMEEHKFTLVDHGPGKCPLTGKPASPDFFLLHNGEKIYFSSEDSLNQYLAIIHAEVVNPEKCVVSGEPIQEGKRLVVTTTKPVYFCCPDCPGPYKKKFFAQEN